MVTSSIHVFDHPRKTYVQESDLAVKMVNLLLKGAVAVPPPIEANRSGHEIDSNYKAQWKDSMFWLTFIFLKDVHTRKCKEGDPHDPEEAATQHM